MKRLECLDGLRGVLAVYVMLGHLAPFAVLPAWIQDIVSHGGAAVDVFFILSGLVITQSLYRAGGQATPFLAARAARIFPAFLPVFALAVLVQPASCGFDHMPWVGSDNAARDNLRDGLAVHLANRDRGTFDNDAWPVSEWRAARCMGQLPWRRLEPVYGMAVLRVHAPRLCRLRQVAKWPDRAGRCRCRLALVDARELAVQSSVFGE